MMTQLEVTTIDLLIAAGQQGRIWEEWTSFSEPRAVSLVVFGQLISVLSTLATAQMAAKKRMTMREKVWKQDHKDQRRLIVTMIYRGARYVRGDQG